MRRIRLDSKGRKAVPFEWEEQVALVELMTIAKIDFYFVPNGGMFPVQHRARLARMGLQPGVPDICIVTPPPRHQPEWKNCRGVYIEMKRVRGGRVSPEQQHWHDKLRKADCYVVVARGFEDARNALIQMGYL